MSLAIGIILLAVVVALGDNADVFIDIVLVGCVLVMLYFACGGVLLLGRFR